MSSRRILILNFNKLGDSIMQTSLVEAMGRQQPEWNISILATFPIVEEVYRNNPHVDHFQLTPQSPEKGFWKYLTTCRQLIESQKIDTVICDPVNSTAKAIFLLRMLQAKVRLISMAQVRSRYRWLLLPLNTYAENYERGQSIRGQFRALCTELNLDWALQPRAYPTSTEVGRLNPSILSESTKPKLALIPFSSKEVTQWPTERVVELTDSLLATHEVFVFGIPADLQPLKERLPGRQSLHLISELNIPQLFAALQKMDLLVSMDTGPSHFFPSLGIPMINISGAHVPADMWSYSGLPQYFRLRENVECSPCYQTKCPVEGHPCMNRIAVSDVLKLVEQTRGN